MMRDQRNPGCLMSGTVSRWNARMFLIERGRNTTTPSNGCRPGNQPGPV
jgi:hypothetical protein